MVDTYVSDAYALSACEFKSHPGHQLDYKINSKNEYLKKKFYFHFL